MNILIVDDHASARRILQKTLAGQDIHTFEADSLESARQVLREKEIHVALVDICLSQDSRNRDGFTLIREIRERHIAVPIVVSFLSEMPDLREAMRNGAYDYIIKEHPELVLPTLRHLRDRQNLEREVMHLRAERVGLKFQDGIVGNSPAIEHLRTLIRKVAVNSVDPVLITGPTGSGKELVARAIHHQGPHPEEPFVPVNCAAIPKELVESELFGHKRGSFTGALSDHLGYFATAKQGTLFLDEVAELPLETQSKLLRVLEDKTFRQVGATSAAPFLGRVVTATHQDLKLAVSERRFREDLYHRLAVLPLRVPGLDQRKQDIPALVAHFLGQQERRLIFREEAMQRLMLRAWPGNVRELRSLVSRIAVFSDSEEVSVEIVESLLDDPPSAGDTSLLRFVVQTILKLPLGNKLEAIEEALITEAMQQKKGVKADAARLLGVHRKVVERRLERERSSDQGMEQRSAGDSSDTGASTGEK